MKMNNYELRFHIFFHDRMLALINTVEKLSLILPEQQFKQHPQTKLLARIVTAYTKIIPENPNLRDYFLSGSLSKFRRYKSGLQRYRLIYCFSNAIQIIVYLYINDEYHLRKDGSKTDPYQEFGDLVKQGILSADPDDPAMKQWLRDSLPRKKSDIIKIEL